MSTERHDSEQKSEQKEEALVRRVLTAAGERPVIPEHFRSSWETTFRDELARARDDVRRQRIARWVPLAAGIAVLGLVVVLFGNRPAVPEALGTVVAVQGYSEIGSREAAEGTQIQSGDVVRTGPSSYLTLDFAGVDVRLAPNTALETHRDRLHLTQGQINMDIGESSSRSTLVVVTAFGEVAHTGTQFLVDVTLDAMILAVREGAVELRISRARVNYRATATSAPLVRVTRRGLIEVSDIDRHGGIWGWTDSAGPGLVVAGRSTHDALSWAARERGLRLEYLTPAARRRAAALLSAPSDHAMGAADVLELVADITYLRVDVTGNGIVRVSERDHDAD